MSAARKLKHAEERNIKVLVVEDEPSIAESYKSILTPAENSSGQRRSSRSTVSPIRPVKSNIEFELTVVGSAKEAIEAVKKAKAEGWSFAMGFFDVLLGPGIDGIDLVKEIHKIDPELLSVFVTAYHDRTVDSINQVLGENMSDRWDYLNKPFSSGEILQKARNYVSLWNIKKDKIKSDQELERLNSKILNAERVSSVAAVARGVGHEFGNILLQIMGRAELSQSQPPEEMKRALEMILKASERASQILDRFNTLSNPADRNTETEFFQAHEPIEESLSILYHQLKSGNFQVKVNKVENLKIEGYFTSFVQLYINLIINACHAMKSDGLIEISIFDEQQNCKIIVRDHGPGIPEAHLEKVLEAFFTTKGSEGTGLGLSICKEIIEIEHAGDFSVSNHPDGGAQFVITIPKSLANVKSGARK